MMIPQFLVRYATTLWRRAFRSAAWCERGSHVNRVVVNTKKENPTSDTIVWIVWNSTSIEAGSAENAGR